MMNEKINLQQLAKALAQKKGLSQKDAETFLREFFDTIIQNVTIDKVAKVRGLGTFKLIEVLERESVNITTGERIVIPGHSKLSFTPDTSLKDMVNKPFADFQTVVINEGTNIEDMERTSEPLPTDDYPEEEEEEIEAQETETEPVSEDVSEEVSEDVSEEVPVTEPDPEPDLMPDPEPEAEAEALQSQPQEEESPQILTEKPAKIRAMTTAEKWALSLGVLLLCVLSYFVGYYHVFDALTAVPQEKEEVWEEPEMEVPIVTVPKSQTPTVNEEVKAPAKTPVVKEDTTPKTFDAGKKYRIIGTRKTHVMKSGDYLTKIAMQEYGDKEFARYIIAHNRFRDPDNVPVGMEIKLPELEEAGD